MSPLLPCISCLSSFHVPVVYTEGEKKNLCLQNSEQSFTDLAKMIWK